MPKAEIPVGYSKVVAEGVYGPTTWANVFYVDTVASDPAHYMDAMLAAAAAINAFYTDLVGIYFHSSFQVSRTRVVYRADPDSLYSTTVADAIAGTASGGGQDAQVSYLINWLSSDPRRGGKPRQYITGVPDSAVADSARLAGSVIAGINSTLATWLAAFPFTHGATGHAQGLVEMSFRSHKAWIDPPIARPIYGGQLNPVVATQRRRVNRLRP